MLPLEGDPLDAHLRRCNKDYLGPKSRWETTDEENPANRHWLVIGFFSRDGTFGDTDYPNAAPSADPQPRPVRVIFSRPALPRVSPLTLEKRPRQ